MASTTVTVGCKLPHGLTIDVGAKKVKLNGVNSSQIVGGYGLTQGVDKDFFETWLAQNAKAATVRNNLIFAQDTATKARDQAVEQEGVKSGLEGLDPEKPAAGIKPENYEGKPKTEDK